VCYFFRRPRTWRRRSPGRLIRRAPATLFTMLGRVGCRVVVTAAAVYNSWLRTHIYIYYYIHNTHAIRPQIGYRRYRAPLCVYPRVYIYIYIYTTLRTIVSLPRTTLTKSSAEQKCEQTDGRTDRRTEWKRERERENDCELYNSLVTYELKKWTKGCERAHRVD